MRTMVTAGCHISLESPPSVGKDTAVEQLAAEEGAPLVTVSGDGGLRARALVGSMSMINGSTVFQVAEFAAAVVNGWWALITEINAADADVLLILNSLMAAPYAVQINGMSYKVHPNFRLFVTYNAGLVGTKPLPQSTKDRFFSIKLSFFNKTQLRNRLEAHGLPALDYGENDVWSDKIVGYGVAMWAAYEAGRMRYQISVRRLIDAITLVKFGADVKSALDDAVVAAIDSPVEAKAARAILREVCNGVR
jgi:MoxR-like ATPase